MSYIAQKKAQQQKKGPETILIYMGATFLIAIALELLIWVIVHWGITSLDFEIQSPEGMVPIVYFLAVGGMCLAVGSKMREEEITAAKVKDWIIGFVFLGVLVGGILGAYMW